MSPGLLSHHICCWCIHQAKTERVSPWALHVRAASLGPLARAECPGTWWLQVPVVVRAEAHGRGQARLRTWFAGASSEGREPEHTGDAPASGVTCFHTDLAARQVGSVPGRALGWKRGGAQMPGPDQVASG